MLSAYDNNISSSFPDIAGILVNENGSKVIATNFTRNKKFLNKKSETENSDLVEHK